MTIDLKRGDSLVWECEYLDDAGAPVDLTSYTISCQARDRNDGVLFSVDSTDGGIEVYAPLDGKFRIRIDNTEDFNAWTYNVDIQYNIGSLVKSSDTFILNIIKDVTR